MIAKMLGGSVKGLVAQSDFQCSCCDEKEGGDKTIKKGEVFFFLQAHRTYAKVWHRGNVQNTIPVIPLHLQKTKAAKGVCPEDFREAVLIGKVCATCLNSVQRLLPMSFFVPVGLGEDVFFQTKGYMWTRVLQAQSQYACSCCKNKIAEKTAYWRFGHLGCVCDKCHDKVVKILGI